MLKIQFFWFLPNFNINYLSLVKNYKINETFSKRFSLIYKKISQSSANVLSYIKAINVSHTCLQLTFFFNQKSQLSYHNKISCFMQFASLFCHPSRLRVFSFFFALFTSECFPLSPLVACKSLRESSVFAGFWMKHLILLWKTPAGVFITQVTRNTHEAQKPADKITSQPPTIDR